MKSVYVIYDNTAQELINCFLANNDKHAIKIISNEMQRQPLDVEFDVYSVCQIDVIDNKKSMIASIINQTENKPIFSYPQSESMKEDELRQNIKQGE